ncbi:MAG TPA: hypothetical protein VKF38_07390 [Anaerolineaceae bacterium]|nr:hypothetical protein [Anaerolineaceae bacterium]
MKDLLRFLETNELWVYLLTGAVSLIYLQKVIVAWQEWRGALFGLERENAQRRLGMALTVLILLGLIALAEFGIVSFVAPSIPELTTLATPTLDLLATPTATLAAGTGTNAAPGSSLPTPAGIAPTAQFVTASQGCIKGQIEWISPSSGEQVSGAVDLQGIVDVPNMGFYKYEYSQPGSSTWTIIAAGNTIVNDKNNKNHIGTWNTGQLPQGDYFLRLVVSDSQNQILSACQVNVQVVSP